MSAPKKRGKKKMSDDQTGLIAEFADRVTENILEFDKDDVDAFEIYAHQLRTHLHVNKDQFKSRFSDGYKALLQELLEKSEG
jgi:hypothetical protein